MNDTFTIEQIKDYQNCPRLYKFKHIMNMQRNNPSEQFNFNESIYKSIIYFYTQLSNLDPITLNKLTSKWYQLYNKQLKTVDDILFSTNTNDRKANEIKAIELLKNFYNNEIEKTYQIVGVNMNVAIPINDYKVIGKIDLIKEFKDNDKEYSQIIKFTKSSKSLIQFNIQNDIDLTFASYAFRKLFQQNESYLNLYSIFKNAEYITQRTDDDYKVLLEIINNVVECINKEMFNPHYTYMCNNCLYRDICEKI